jgi:hypothetical protein
VGLLGLGGLSSFAEEDAPAILRQMPGITITGGVVSTDAEEPYYITEPDTGKVIAIIDTTGEWTSLEGTDAGILLTRDKVIVKKNTGNTEVHDLSQVESFSMDREWLESWLGTVVTWGPILAFPFAVIGSYVYRIVQALIYALIGLLLRSIAGASLEYPAILRIAMVAVTPAVVLKTFMGVVGVELPVGWLIYFAVAMGYLYFGISATCAPDAPEPGAGRPDGQNPYGPDAATPGGGEAFPGGGAV